MGAPFLARSLREKWGFSTERAEVAGVQNAAAKWT